MDYALIGKNLRQEKDVSDLGTGSLILGACSREKLFFHKFVEPIHPQQFRRCVAPPIRAPGGSREGTKDRQFITVNSFDKKASFESFNPSRGLRLLKHALRSGVPGFKAIDKKSPEVERES